MVYEDVFDEIPRLDAPSSEYRPPLQRMYDFFHKSPVRLQPRVASSSSAGCHLPEDQHLEPSDDESDPETPSRQSQRRTSKPARYLHPVAKNSSTEHGPGRKNSTWQYCTQKCLLSLVEGNMLDEKCPNVQHHGNSRHQIDQPTFFMLLGQQLSKDIDTSCDPLHIYGLRGALFKVSLTSHEYTVAVKSTIFEFVIALRHEAAMSPSSDPEYSHSGSPREPILTDHNPTMVLRNSFI